MRHDPADPHWLGRDRFVLSAGHSSLTLYIQLYLSGYGLELDDLKALRTWGSQTPGHPEYGHTDGVEITTGPLGQGLANAVGMAMAARRERGLFDPDAAARREPVRPPRLRHRLRRRPRGGRHAARRPRSPAPAARQPHRDLRRQPDLDRGRHRRSPSPRTSPRATRPTAGTSRRVDWTATAPARTYVPEDVEALYDALARRQGRDRPAVARSSCARSSAGPRRTQQNTGKAHGSALGADEVARHQEGPRLRPRRRPSQVDDERARPRPRGRSTAAPRRTPSGTSAFAAWAAANPEPGRAAATGCATRRAARRLDRRAADFRRPARTSPPARPPAKVLNALGRRAARAVGRLGRPRRVATTPRSRASPRSSRPARRRPRCGRATPTAASCTSASASTPWARSSTASRCTAAPAPSAARSWSSATTCARRSGWPR